MGKKTEERHKSDFKSGYHKPIENDCDGGACLTSHDSRGGEDRRGEPCSCNYRWQAWSKEETANEKGNKEYFSRKRRAAAHHIIPNEQLNAAIETAADASNVEDLRATLRMALLDAEYNLNHWRNMIVMPRTKAGSERLNNLPQHRGNHSAYSADVREKVDAVISTIVSYLEDAIGNGKHPGLPDSISKARLEKASDDMRQVVKKYTGPILL